MRMSKRNPNFVFRNITKRYHREVVTLELSFEWPHFVISPTLTSRIRIGMLHRLSV